MTAAKMPADDWPCKYCEQYKKSRCTRPLTPDKHSYCVLWHAWFCKWWPIVTGRKNKEECK